MLKVGTMSIDERHEPFVTIRQLRDLIVEGILPNQTRISKSTRDRLLQLVAAALAVARDERSVQYDVRRAILVLVNAMGEAGFLGCDRLTWDTSARTTSPISIPSRTDLVRRPTTWK